MCKDQTCWLVTKHLAKCDGMHPSFSCMYAMNAFCQKFNCSLYPMSLDLVLVSSDFRLCTSICNLGSTLLPIAPPHCLAHPKITQMVGMQEQGI